MRVGRHFFIDSSHLLPGHAKCGVMHGHTYRIDIELEDSVDDTGMVLDFGEICVKTEAFLEHLDHVHLNEVLPMPTVENLVSHVFEGLREVLPALARVRIWEGRGKYAELDIRDAD
jgi:6-pyruvoyltetrahydropterin/6-carboxytetrahydropterin synthase